MKVRGLSYQKGIFYIGKQHVACAYHEKSRLKSWLKPLSAKTLLLMGKQIFFSMPLWFKLLSLVVLGSVFIPKLLAASFAGWEGLPYYVLLYFMFGTHFIFPAQLRRYHGAEHKVFSTKGVIRRAGMPRIKRAAITNRYCSTNTVVIYFSSVVVLTIVISCFNGVGEPSLALASYMAVAAIPVVATLMTKKGFRWLENLILRISYWLQIHITTAEPEHQHLLASIESYRKLAAKEFPERLVVKRPIRIKEEKHMAIVDVTIIPIGTEDPSVSAHVAEVHQVLKQYEGKITYQLTPMSTLIEGELPVLFEVIQAIHEVPFQHGVKRVATNIRIDDRRDKVSTMDGKLAAVQGKLAEKTEPAAIEKNQTEESVAPLQK